MLVRRVVLVCARTQHYGTFWSTRYVLVHSCVSVVHPSDDDCWNGGFDHQPTINQQRSWDETKYGAWWQQFQQMPNFIESETIIFFQVPWHLINPDPQIHMVISASASRNHGFGAGQAAREALPVGRRHVPWTSDIGPCGRLWAAEVRARPLPCPGKPYIYII